MAQDRGLTPEELAELLSESAQAPNGNEAEEAPTPGRKEFGVGEVPVTLHLKNGRYFKVTDVDAWSTTPLGLFATGFFVSEDDPDEIERDMIFPYDTIDDYEFDFPALETLEHVEDLERALDDDNLTDEPNTEDDNG